jgi:hypothetical protein
MSVRLLKCGFVVLLLFGSISCAADDLKVVVLDSKNGHALRGKLVCIMPPANPRDPVILEQSRVCHRTDSGGTALFRLTDPVPEAVKVMFASDGLVPCFPPHSFVVADAMKEGTVATNTCGDASTDTTEKGEVVLFAHQKSIKEALDTVRNEW